MALFAYRVARTDGSTLDGVTGRVELVAIQPDPALVRRPVVHPDDAEKHRRRELDAGRLRHMYDIAGPRKHVISCPEPSRGKFHFAAQ